MTKKQVTDSWESGDAYEQYIGRWSRKVAHPFLSWLNIPASKKWLDVGCGTGALSATITDFCSPSSVTAIEPSEGFLNTARGYLKERVFIRAVQIIYQLMIPLLMW